MLDCVQEEVFSRGGQGCRGRYGSCWRKEGGNFEVKWTEEEFMWVFVRREI